MGRPRYFSGFSLNELKGYVDELMAYDKTIPATYYGENDVVETVEINPPRIFTGMTELYDNKLMENGIEVCVVSAAHEELVRMVAADPEYGYNVPPENVIGVTTLLEDPATGTFTTARKLVAEGAYDWPATMDYVMRPYLWTPGAWMEGKQAAILAYIDQWRPAALIAGDTPISDGYMLLHGVDTEKGGRVSGRPARTLPHADRGGVDRRQRREAARARPGGDRRQGFDLRQARGHPVAVAPVAATRRAPRCAPAARPDRVRRCAGRASA